MNEAAVRTEMTPMRPRGRPPKKSGPPRYANRLRELRHRLGMSQQEVANAARISSAYYGALERGNKRINADTAQRLQISLRCSVSDLLAGSRGISLPVRFAVAAAEAATRPESFELPEPHEMVQPGRLAGAEHCFGAEVTDDSADRDFAPGTVLLLRPLDGSTEPLRRGTRVVVRFFLDGDGSRTTYEILYGILDRNILGDLVLITRTRNRLIPRHALVRPAGSSRAGLESPTADETIDYRYGPNDPAEVLGSVVYVMGPVGTGLALG